MAPIEPISIITAFASAVTYFTFAWHIHSQKLVNSYIPMFLLLWSCASLLDGFYHFLHQPLIAAAFYSTVFFAFTFLAKSVSNPLKVSEESGIVTERRTKLNPVSYMIIYAAAMGVAALFPGAIVSEKSTATWYFIGELGFFVGFYIAFSWLFWSYWRHRTKVLHTSIITTHKAAIALFLVSFFSMPLVLSLEYGAPLLPEGILDIIVLALTLTIVTPGYLFAARKSSFDQFFWTFSNKDQLELLKIAIQQSTESIAIADRASRIVFANTNWAEMHGYEQDELAGKKLDSIYCADHVEEIEAMAESLLWKGSWSGEICHQRKDGSTYPTLTTASILRDSKGRSIATLAISRDITERKKMENRLEETNKRLQMLLETAREGIITADPDENITFVNQTFADNLAYTQEELLGLNLRKLVDEQGLKQIIEGTESRKAGEIGRYEFVLYRKDGEPRTVQVTASPLLSEDGGFAGSLGIMMDVTERKKMEEQLRESQQKFERLFKSNPEASVFVDMNDRVLDVNPRFSELFGFSLEGVKGKALDDLIVPEDRKEEAKVLTEESLSGYIFRETIRRTKNGLLVPVLISAAPITIEGRLTGCVVSYRDITDRKDMEERLRESEERFRSIAERSFDAIATVDMKGTITYASPSVGKVLGYPQSEVMGKSFLEYFSPAKLSDATQLFTDLMQGKNLEGLQLGLSKTDGTMATVEINASPIIMNGEVTGIQAVFRDITQRKKIEEALRASEERFRGITERSFDIIATIDSNGLITYISPSVERIIGYAAEEVTGKPFQDFFTTSNVSDVIKVFTEALQGKSGEGLVFGVTRKDGTQALVEVNVSPITKNGEIVGIQGVARDITERKKMEDALRESEEKLRHTLESSPDAIILTDLAGNVIDCNQAALDMYGFSTKEEAVGKAGFQFISAKDYEKAIESMKTILEKGSARNIEYTLLTKDGKEFLVDVSASVIRDASGEPKYIVAITRDITQRKKMEEALRESEEKHRLLFENVNDVVFAYDHEFTILSVSPSVEKTLGYKPEELVGRKFQELSLLAPESLETAMDNALHVLEGESISPSVYEFVKKDGTKGFGEITSSPLMREGKVVGVIAVARDITERKQMEEKIRESEERLRQLIEFAPDAIYMNDSNGLFLGGNKQAEIMLGYKKEELIGKNMLEAGILPEEYAPKAVELVQKTMDGQKTGPDEMELIRKDGTRIWVEISSMPVKRGDRIEVLGIARDITNRKRIENALRESEEKIRNILQSSPDAIAVTDLDGTMVDCNQEALRLAGVSTKEELLGKNTFDLISPKEYEKSMKNMEILLEQGTVRDFEFTLIAKDGREFPAEVSMSLMRDSTGEPKYFVATIRNITERKEMLRKLEEYSQQLEEMVEKRTKQLKEAQEQLVKAERLAAIGQVAAMVGHDLRNPLTGIKGAAYYLKTRPALKTDKKTMEMLELIEKDIEYSNKIITDLLEYSRDVHLELTEAAPRSVVSETLSLLEVPKNVETINLTQDEPRIKVDIEKLNRVFINLIKNAIDAMPYGGKMTIKSTRTNDDVEFAFTDTGMGMTKEQMGKLWTPFFTTKAKGMGLGLPICKRIVEAHRGSIKVESMAGLGTTFTVTVPIEPKQAEGGEKIWVKTPESLSLTTTKASEKS